MTLRVGYLVKRSSWRAFQETKDAGKLRALQRRKDPTVASLRPTHEAHQRTVDEVMAAFDSLGLDAVEIDAKTRDLTKKKFALVVTVGGDGTLLRASHYVADVPVLGINSAPDSSVGFFCGAAGWSRKEIAGVAERQGLLETLERALDGRMQARVLSRMRVTIGKKIVSSRILNDALFCHRSPAATSRYLIEAKGITEEHKSSGLWVGPAAGSTAAQRSAGGKVLPLESDKLQLVVREPYTPKGERYRLRTFTVGPGEPIVVRSKMREAVIFLDGPDLVVKPEFGDVITFARSSEPLSLLGLATRRSVSSKRD